jgi:hypothetical protein
MIRLKHLLEQTQTADTMHAQLVKRVPFLKSFNVYEHPRDPKRFEAQRVVYNKDVSTTMGNDIITFPQFNVSSEVIYYPHTIDEHTFHYFIVKNAFHVMQPKNMDDLTFRVLLYAIKSLQDKFSYSKELMLPAGRAIPDQDMHAIVNSMNRTFFEIEEYTNKHNIDLF